MLLGRRIFDTLQDYKLYKDARRISIYLSMPAAEVQTDSLVRHALLAGKQVFVPYLHKSTLTTPDTPVRVMEMVRLNSVQDYESLLPDKWGIPSIDAATVAERECILGNDTGTLDLMLVPGVAFDLDERGSVRRLGHGKGFYDFFLNRYFAREGTKEGGLKTIGLGLQQQWLDPLAAEEVPMGEYDRVLHGVILGDGSIKESK